MFKYISNIRLNVAILIQITGLILIVKATLPDLALGVAALITGAVIYRRELKRLSQENRSTGSDAAP